MDAWHHYRQKELRVCTTHSLGLVLVLKGRSESLGGCRHDHRFILIGRLSFWGYFSEFLLAVVQVDFADFADATACFELVWTLLLFFSGLVLFRNLKGPPNS